MALSDAQSSSVAIPSAVRTWNTSCIHGCETLLVASSGNSSAVQVAASLLSQL